MSQRLTSAIVIALLIILITPMGLMLFPDVIIDIQGGTLRDYSRAISAYGSITLMLYFVWRHTKSLIILFLFLLSWGKLSDQFYSPYDYGMVEKIWDFIVIIIISILTAKRLLSRKKKNG